MKERSSRPGSNARAFLFLPRPPEYRPEDSYKKEYEIIGVVFQ